MPIQYQQVDDLILSRLDAHGTDHYRLDTQRIPAVNSALDFIVATIGPRLGTKRFPDKILSELLFPRIWQTSTYGRVFMAEAALNAGGQGPIWDIVSCYAEPETIPPNPGITAGADESSSLRGNVSFRNSDFACKRITHEQLADTGKSHLMGGSEYLAGSALRSYYYMVLGYGRTSPDYLTNGWELQFGPLSLTGKKLVCITHLKTPNKVTAYGATIEFPPMMLDLIVSRALHYLSIKQGDGTTLWRTQAEDTALLMQMFT